jgi:hypothetical protein
MQISDTWLYSSHVTIALIYLMQLKLLAVVHLTRVLDASNRLERPALALSIIDNDLHIISCYVTLLYFTMPLFHLPIKRVPCSLLAASL